MQDVKGRDKHDIEVRGHTCKLLIERCANCGGWAVEYVARFTAPGPYDHGISRPIAGMCVQEPGIIARFFGYTLEKRIARAVETLKQHILRETRPDLDEVALREKFGAYGFHDVGRISTLHARSRDDTHS